MADTQPYRPRKRGYETASDMLRSLIPIVIMVVGFAFFCIPRGDERDPRIDPQVDIDSAAQTVGFPILAPASLNEAWVPTSSKLLRTGDAEQGTPEGLTIGYITPDEEFARYTVRRGERLAVINAAIAPDKITKDPDGSGIELSGQEWVPITTTQGRAYVSVTGAGDTAIVLVVSGGAAYSELAELAGSLKPVAA